MTDRNATSATTTSITTTSITTTSPAAGGGTNPRRTGARRLAVIVIGSLAVLFAAFTLLWSVATTSTAQLSASTSGSGFFTAGTVELDQPETTVALLFDASGLFPGRVVSSCISIAYEGTLPADVRLHASRTGGTGLEDHVELTLSRSTAGSCPEDSDAAANEEAIERGVPVFTGLLGDLWQAHPDYAGGLSLIERAEQGDRLVLDAVIEMVGGDEAQGLTTEFAIIIEARP